MLEIRPFPAHQPTHGNRCGVLVPGRFPGQQFITAVKGLLHERYGYLDLTANLFKDVLHKIGDRGALCIPKDIDPRMVTLEAAYLPRMLGACYVQIPASHIFLWKGFMENLAPATSHTVVYSLWQMVRMKDRLFIQHYDRSTYASGVPIEAIASDDILSLALENGSPVIVADSSRDSRIKLPRDKECAKSMAAVPLTIMGQKMVFLYHRDIDDPFLASLTQTVSFLRHAPGVPENLFVLLNHKDAKNPFFITVEGLPRDEDIRARDDYWQEDKKVLLNDLLFTVGCALDRLHQTNTFFVRIHLDKRMTWQSPQPRQAQLPPAIAHWPRTASISLPGLLPHRVHELDEPLMRKYCDRLAILLQDHAIEHGAM